MSVHFVNGDKSRKQTYRQCLLGVCVLSNKLKEFYLCRLFRIILKLCYKVYKTIYYKKIFL